MIQLIRFLMNRIKIRIRAFVRLNYIVFPSILKHKHPIIRKYVIYRWIQLNLVYLNPFKKITSLIFVRFKLRFSRQFQVCKKEISLDRYFPYSMKIVVINLHHRKDRLNSITNQLQKIGIHKWQRFEAIKRDYGMEGCTLSHIMVIEEFNQESHDYLMVIEDDAIFNQDFNTIKNLVDSFLVDEKLDVLCLGFNAFNKVYYNDIFDITTDTQTTSCYIIKPKVRSEFIKVFNLAYLLQCNRLDDQFGSAIDVVWKMLQLKYNFVIPKSHIVTQMPSISDSGITPHFVDYGV